MDWKTYLIIRTKTLEFTFSFLIRYYSMLDSTESSSASSSKKSAISSLKFPFKLTKGQIEASGVPSYIIGYRLILVCTAYIFIFAFATLRYLQTYWTYYGSTSNTGIIEFITAPVITFVLG